jgi:hypothetical protein
MAMIAHAGGADTDPGKLADYMRGHNGFDGARVKWRAIDGLNYGYRSDGNNGDGLQYNDDGSVDLDDSTPVDVTDMDDYLSDGALIIAQVYNPSTHGNHWVLVTGKDGSEYSIIDPGCYVGRTTLSNGYGNNIYRFIVYEKL